MKTVEVDAGPSGGGVFVYYLFRFKNDPPDNFSKDGWLAGVSGPFRKRDFPTTDAWGARDDRCRTATTALWRARLAR